MSAYTLPNENYREFAEAVKLLRTRLKLPHNQLASKLGMQNDDTLRAWEEGRHLGGKSYLTSLETLARHHNWLDLAEQFSSLKRRRAELASPARNVPGLDVNLARNGRESGLGEVIHLIDERCAEIRGNQAMFEKLSASGMSVSDIVAHELDTLKASIRGLPVVLKRYAQTA